MMITVEIYNTVLPWLVKKDRMVERALKFVKYGTTCQTRRYCNYLHKVRSSERLWGLIVSSETPPVASFTNTWWRHDDLEKLLLASCEWNVPIFGGFP